MKIIERQWDGADALLPVPEQSYVLYWLADRPVGHCLAAAGVVPSRPALPVSMPQLATKATSIIPASVPPSAVDISLVICTRDRPIPLAACLAALSRQSVRAREIIVVDNASHGNETRDVTLAAGATYLREDRAGLDFARNAGAFAAAGAIIAYTDDDVVLHPRWIEQMAAAFSDAAVAAVTGLVLPAELDTEAQRFFEFHWGFNRGYERLDFGPEFFASDRSDCCRTWEIGAGASMAFRREVLEQIGYFDERLDVGRSGCSGDSEAWHRVLAAGHICRYDPAIVAFHYHRREMADLERQIFSYMRGHSSSVLVQFGTTGGKGNLRRILFDLPRNYAQRIRGRLRDGPKDDNRMLWQEIRGFLSGIVFILRNPRSPVKRRLARREARRRDNRIEVGEARSPAERGARPRG